MKRILTAAALAVAALSLPATAALADGYERPRHHAKAKPHKAKPHKAKKHARKHHHHYRGEVKDYASIYGARSYVSVDVESHEAVTRTYYEERDGWSYGPVTQHWERHVPPQQVCHPNAPCTWGAAPVRLDGPGWAWSGHPGGVGYGVDGGAVWSGGTWIVPGGAVASSHAHSAAHASAVARAHAFSHGGGHVVRPHRRPHRGHCCR